MPSNQVSNPSATGNLDARSFRRAAVTFLAITVALLANLGLADERRPNILWIFIEDMNPMLGCYGDRLNASHTPTIDALARQGVLFERAYATAPVCSASRSAVILGRMQTTTGYHQHRSARCVPKDDPNPDNLRPLPDTLKPIPQLLRENGYHTFNNGKDDYNFSYDRTLLYSSGNPEDYQYPYNGWQGWRGTGSWRDRTDPDQPWFGQIMLWGGKNNLKGLPESERLAPDQVNLPPFFPDLAPFRNDWAHHWNACRVTDLEVKTIVDDLRTDGELENTIIFFFSDHGMQESLRHKQFCYEGGLHVPLIVSGQHPRLAPDTRRSDLVSLLDVSATTLTLAHLAVPEHFDGQDLFGTDHQPREFVISARDRCDYTIDRIRTVRTDRFRYIRNFKLDRPMLQPQYRDGYATMKLLRSMNADGTLAPELAQIYFGQRPAEELYDLENDPDQMNNLATSDEHASELKRHRGILDDWIRTTDDQGAYPESDAEMRAQVRFWKDKCVNPEYEPYLDILSPKTGPEIGD